MSMSSVSKILFLITLVIACSLMAWSCGEKNAKAEDSTSKDVLSSQYNEGQCITYEGHGENGFQMYINLYQDNTARVLSGCPQYSESQLIDGTADIEYLTWSKTADGFVLEDPSAGRLYTAVIRQGQNWDDDTGMPFGVTISWSHSAGNCWETHAIEKGWKKVASLNLWINLWGDDLY